MAQLFISHFGQNGTHTLLLRRNNITFEKFPHCELSAQMFQNHGTYVGIVAGSVIAWTATRRPELLVQKESIGYIIDQVIAQRTSNDFNNFFHILVVIDIQHAAFWQTILAQFHLPLFRVRHRTHHILPQPGDKLFGF